MITAQCVEEAARRYLDKHLGEAGTVSVLLDLLASGTDVLSRTEFRGHVSVSGVLYNEGRVLHMYHAGRRRWMLPGTHHLEEHDSSLDQAALRYLAEVTGFDPRTIILAQEGPLHFEVLSVSESKGVPAHFHFDFRFLFQTAATTPFQSGETIDLAWRRLHEMRDEDVADRAAQRIGGRPVLRSVSL